MWQYAHGELLTQEAHMNLRFTVLLVLHHKGMVDCIIGQVVKLNLQAPLLPGDQGDITYFKVPTL